MKGTYSVVRVLSMSDTNNCGVAAYNHTRRPHEGCAKRTGPSPEVTPY